MGLFNQKDIQRWERHCAVVQQATTIDPFESEKVKRERIARAKKDYAFFFEYYLKNYAKSKSAKFHIKIANAIKKNRTFKGIWEAFRGAAKSVHGTIGIPLWLMIQDEMKCMLLVGQTEKKACRLLGSIQAQLQNNQRFINDFGAQVQSGNWSEGEFVTKQGVSFFAIGLGQDPAGTRMNENRPDYIAADDLDSKQRSKNPARVREAIDWILSELMGTFDIGNERFLLMNNRTAKGSILAKMVEELVEDQPKKKKWFYLKVNAVINKRFDPSWPGKYTREYWIKKREGMVLRAWEQNFMNNPIEEGVIFNKKWIQWKKMLKLQVYDGIVVYYDPSFKHNPRSDFKAVKMWGKIGKEFHLLKAIVKQASRQTIVSLMYDLAEELPGDINVHWYYEANANQEDTHMEDFVAEGDERGWQLNIRPDRRKKPDKYGRIESMSVRYEKSWVYYNIDEKDNADMREGTEQLLAIEPGYQTPDDSPDADEGAWHYLDKIGKRMRNKPKTGARRMKKQGRIKTAKKRVSRGRAHSLLTITKVAA